MKKLIFALAVATIVSAAPSSAQQLNSNPTYDFLKAVRDRDGTKANEVLNDHPGVVNTRDTTGETALNIALSRKDEDWTGFMINNGADVNLAGRGNDTPLIAAARVGFDQGVTWLLQRGAKVGLACDGCAAGLEATIAYIAPQAEFTPPVIYSKDARAKLVFLVEARPVAAHAALRPGLPVEVSLGK